MLNLRTTYETDPRLDEQGTWTEIGGGAKILVARWLNKNHVSVVRRLQKPFEFFGNAGQDIPSDINEKIELQAIAEAILLGWEGIADGDKVDEMMRAGTMPLLSNGEPDPAQMPELPYSVSNAYDELARPGAFARIVREQANKLALFKRRQEKAAVGELQPGSAGSESGATTSIS